jgi:hypothetical protein
MMAIKEYAPSNYNQETEKTLEPSPELIAAVDEAFTDQVTALESLPINPEQEQQLGSWVKMPGGDKTAGVLSE